MQRIVKEHLMRRKKMKVQIVENYEEMSQKASQMIIATFQKYPQGLYCFAGGDTPVRTLQLLVEAHQKKIIDLKQAFYIELDEWAGLDQSNSGSCLAYLNKNLFEPASVDYEHIHAFNSLANDLENECQKANNFLIEHGGLTLTLLGVGQNGHLGFNEPGVNFENNAYVIDLDMTTKTVGQKYFQTEEVLSKGITLGLKQLMASKVVIVEANGTKKQPPIKKVLDGQVDEMCPVTIINNHPQVCLIIDKLAMEKE